MSYSREPGASIGCLFFVLAAGLFVFFAEHGPAIAERILGNC